MKIITRISEEKDFDRWWRWVEYERGRVFQYDLFDVNKLIEHERISQKWRDEGLKK
jgi:hypothetical protein